MKTWRRYLQHRAALTRAVNRHGVHSRQADAARELLLDAWLGLSSKERRRAIWF